MPLSSHEGGGTWTYHVLANPELEAGTRGFIAPHTIAVRRDRMVGDGAVHEIIGLTNFGADRVHLSLELASSAARPRAPGALPGGL